MASQALNDLAENAALVANQVSKIIHKQGLIDGLVGLIGTAQNLAALDYSQVRLGLLDDDSRKAAEGVLAANLLLQNAVVQAKLLSAGGLLERAVELAEQGAKLVSDVKALLS